MDKKQLGLNFPVTKDMEISEDSMYESVKQGIDFKDYTDAEKNNFWEISKNRMLVKECWYRDYKRAKFIITEDKRAVPVDDEKPEVLNLIIQRYPQMKLIERVMPELNVAIYVNDQILYEKADPYEGCTRFPIVRFCNEMIFAEKPIIRGEVEDIIGPQEELNKRKSQMLHILNSTPNSGYIVEKGALTPDAARKLERMGSKPGVVIDVEEGKLSAIKKIEPPQLSTSHAELANMADVDMKSISGVNADLLGNDRTDSASGIAMEMRRRQGLINVEPVYDNLDFTMRVLGDTLLDIVRKTDAYTPEEIAAIVGEKGVRNVNGEPMDIEAIQLYMKTAKGRYSVSVSQKSNNPTIRAGNFKDMISAVKEAGIPIPPEMIVEESDWSFKDRWSEWQKQQQAQQAPQGPMGQGGQPVPPDMQQFLGGMGQGQPVGA